MEKGLIDQSLYSICILEGKPISEVVQYLKMKYRIEVEILVLEKRLTKFQAEGKAVA